MGGEYVRNIKEPENITCTYCCFGSFRNFYARKVKAEVKEPIKQNEPEHEPENPDAAATGQ